MKKKLLFLAIAVFTLSAISAQNLTSLVFEPTILPTGDVSLTFDYDGVSAGDTFEWQLLLALPDGSPDWGSGRNVAYLTGIVPDNTGAGTQTVTLGLYNMPVEGEVFTWAGKITLGSDGSDTGYNNTGNLVTISNTASTNEFENLKISMYPNPSSDFINISNDNLEIKNIQIFNLIGKKITEIKAQNNRVINIDISNFSKGIYLISVDNRASAKFVKQ